MYPYMSQCTLPYTPTFLTWPNMLVCTPTSPYFMCSCAPLFASCVMCILIYPYVLLLYVPKTSLHTPIPYAPLMFPYLMCPYTLLWASTLFTPIHPHAPLCALHTYLTHLCGLRFLFGWCSPTQPIILLGLLYLICIKPWYFPHHPPKKMCTYPK